MRLACSDSGRSLIPFYVFYQIYRRAVSHATVLPDVNVLAGTDQAQRPPSPQYYHQNNLKTRQIQHTRTAVLDTSKADNDSNNTGGGQWGSQDANGTRVHI